MDDWYQESLDRKHKRILLSMAVDYWFPRICGLVAVVTLIGIWING